MNEERERRERERRERGERETRDEREKKEQVGQAKKRTKSLKGQRREGKKSDAGRPRVCLAHIRYDMSACYGRESEGRRGEETRKGVERERRECESGIEATP